MGRTALSPSPANAGSTAVMPLIRTKTKGMTSRLRSRTGLLLDDDLPGSTLGQLANHRAPSGFVRSAVMYLP